MRRAILPVALAAVALAGCGKSDDREPRPGIERRDLAPGPADPRAFERFEKCLRDNGVEVPDRPSGPVEPPPADVRSECEEHLPEAVPPPGEQRREVPLP